MREACADDGEVRTEVEALLRAHQEAGRFAESGLGIEDLGFDLIGRDIGTYRILSQLGAGGMGEVYRARDTKLGRDVAIKVLPFAFTADRDRLARFEREARVLATLNHPHIGAIYGFEESKGIRALVLELVEGETLAELLARSGRGFSLDVALTIARQIAEALEAAHEKGIIHRDLKPANIILQGARGPTPTRWQTGASSVDSPPRVSDEINVKVLDFGLAKAASGNGSDPDLTQSPNVTANGTRQGMMLGTPAYMSPEQARGHVVDKRTDIWAFGCVLYEMLAGQPAFARETISDTIGAVMRGDPDWSALPVNLSRTLQVFLRRCLHKNPHDRLHDIADLRLALDGAFEQPPEVPIDARTVAIDANKSGWRMSSAIALAAVVLLGLGATTAWLLKSAQSERPTVTQPVARVSVPTHPLAVLVRATSSVMALSPDGSHLVYVAGDREIRGIEGNVRGAGQLYVRRLDSFEAKPIQGADDAQGPFFSPDGKWIAFFADDQLKKVSLAGGLPVPLCAAAGLRHGGSWGADDRIIFPDYGGLWHVSGNGGKPELVVPTDSAALWPEFLPDGNAVLFTTIGPERIWIHSLRTGQRRLLVEGGSHARYVSSGHVVYASEGSLMAVPFDAERLELIGSAVPVIQGVMMGLPGEPVLGHFAVSASGSLAYLAGSVLNLQQTMVWVDRRGHEESLNVNPRSYASPRISPDGTRLAVEVVESGNRDVWIYDLVRKTFRPLTFDPASDGRPVWTPDGRRIAFSSTRDRGGFNLFWQPADGAPQVERLTTEPNSNRNPWAFTPDAKMLVFSEANPDTQIDVHLLSMERGYPSKPLLHERFIEGHPALSPDGRWIAYRSNETGRLEVYVRPFPRVDEGKWPITTDGGSVPFWAPSGRELFYQNGDLVMVVPIETEPTFTPGKPQVLFSWGLPLNFRNVDVSPDGQRFLVIKDVPQTLEPSARDEITVVLNWAEELKRLVPPRK